MKANVEGIGRKREREKGEKEGEKEREEKGSRPHPNFIALFPPFNVTAQYLLYITVHCTLLTIAVR